MKVFAIVAACLVVIGAGGYGFYSHVISSGEETSCPVATEGGCCLTTPSTPPCCELSTDPSAEREACGLVSDLCGTGATQVLTTVKESQEEAPACEFCASPTRTITSAAKAIVTPK